MTDQVSIQNSANSTNAGFGGKEIKTIKLWLKAFVPASVEQGALVPGSDTLTMETQFNRAFLTDQREFSSDIHASARMHSEIEIDLVRRKQVYEFHHCYETVEVDARTGEEKCRKLGETENMHFSDVEFFDDGVAASGDGTSAGSGGGTSAGSHFGCSFTVKASSKNPCIAIATVKIMPNLDYEGTIHIELSDDRQRATISFDGLIESYPAFEMYAVVNNGEPQTVFQMPIAEGATSSAMMGPPNRPISHQVQVTA